MVIIGERGITAQSGAAWRTSHGLLDYDSEAIAHMHTYLTLHCANVP